MKTHDATYISERIAVPPEFSEVFSHFYQAENNTLQTVRKTLVPSFQTILVFCFGADILLHSRQQNTIGVNRCMLLGPIKQSFDYALPPGAQMLVVNFKADAFYRFFGQAMLWGSQPMQPDILIGENCFVDLWHQLKLMDKNERVGQILHFSLPYLKKRNDVLQQLTAATTAQSPLSPVKTVASGTGRSQRSVQLYFKKYFGYSAKEVTRYQRFLKAAAIIQAFAAQGLKADWFEIIEQCAYYDQSQMIHDFKHYMNITPLQYLRFQEDICVAG